MNNIVDYIALYIEKLKPTHAAVIAFGAEFVADESSPALNVFRFAFPYEPDGQLFNHEGISDHILNTNAQGICISPLGGGQPDPQSGCVSPYFSLLCRHSLSGRAFNTLYALNYELQNNARVFPQNGKILAITSQPSLIYADGRSAYVFQLIMKAIVAEPIF